MDQSLLQRWMTVLCISAVLGAVYLVLGRGDVAAPAQLTGTPAPGTILGNDIVVTLHGQAKLLPTENFVELLNGCTALYKSDVDLRQSVSKSQFPWLTKTIVDHEVNSHEALAMAEHCKSYRRYEIPD